MRLQVVVIGGGYIGMEVGSNLSKHGLEVTLVYPEKHLMERLFTPEIASFYEEYYKNKGIKLQPESLATSFEGEGGKVRCHTLCPCHCWWLRYGVSARLHLNVLV